LIFVEKIIIIIGIIKQVREKVEGNRSGQMVLSMKVNGETTKPMEKED